MADINPTLMIPTFILGLIALIIGLTRKKTVFTVIGILLFFLTLVEFLVIRFLPGTDFWPM